CRRRRSRDASQSLLLAAARSADDDPRGRSEVGMSEHFQKSDAPVAHAEEGSVLLEGLELDLDHACVLIAKVPLHDEYVAGGRAVGRAGLQQGKETPGATTRDLTVHAHAVGVELRSRIVALTGP